MSEKFSPKKALAFGICATLAYKFVKGDGIFNKPRFFEQHKAVENYLATYHPSAKTSNIVKNDSGWHCVVTTNEKSFVLNIHKTDDKTYVFSETEL